MHLVDFINSDVRTLTLVIFWYNLITIIINALYFSMSKEKIKGQLLKIYTVAKSCQAVASFLLLGRGFFIDFLSVNLGNSFLLIGFFAETLVILEALSMNTKKNATIMQIVLYISLICFNLTELLVPSSNMRVASASICVFIIMIVPSILLITNINSKAFKRLLGLFYLIFTLMLLPRIVLMLNNNEASLFSNGVVQSMTFLSLIFVNFLGSTTYLLYMREYIDKINEAMAKQDYLTKLLNRYAFLTLVEKRFHQHIKLENPISILFLDLDKFKKINDENGHLFGDEVLVKFAEILKSSLRENDLLCRYGGEEFVIALPNSDLSVAYRVAERLLKKTSEARFEAMPEFKFTTSIGIASGVPKEKDVFSKYLSLADKAMYKAKAKGGNTIEYELED